MAEKIERMRQLFAAGKTWREIADELGISHAVARDLGIKHGLRRRATRADMHRNREARREQLIAMFRNGAGWVEIGRAFGIPPTTARSMGAAFGLPPRAMKPQKLRRVPPVDPPAEMSVESEAPSPEDATASEDSLRLSPYVLRRIEELGIHGRRVQPAESWQLPVFAGE